MISIHKSPKASPVSAAEEQLKAVLDELLHVPLDDAEAFRKLKSESVRLQEIIRDTPGWDISERVLRSLP